MARHRSGSRPSSGTAGWESERTLADVEQQEKEELEAQGEPSAGTEGSTLCACGSSEFLLEAYLRVADGRPSPEPVEVENLTCPHCGREYEPVRCENGRVLRGEFLGYVELD